MDVEGEQDGRGGEVEGVEEDERGGVEGEAESDAADDEDGEWRAVVVKREEVGEEMRREVRGEVSGKASGEVRDEAAAPYPQGGRGREKELTQ